MRQQTISPEKHMPSKVPLPACYVTRSQVVPHPRWPDPIFVQTRRAIAHVTPTAGLASDRTDTAQDRDPMSPGQNLKYFN